ncbi:MAG: Heavy metal transport/detoxification protein [Candidatus Peregrinibacteria bacterium Gr01-1014_25]|nr:MAG: Heavy metal transport/detoxification protein [Candidatus Peregrinibacteria bacterium Gr01-1014_25]
MAGGILYSFLPFMRMAKLSSKSGKAECQATVCIAGMTCASCEILLERKLKAVPGVTAVAVDHKKGTANITADGSRLPSRSRIAATIREAGYSLLDDAPTASSVAPGKRKWMEIGASLIVIVAIYKLLQAFDLVSLAPSTSGALSVGGIFVIGLVAGTSSCLAVTGGLLLALAAKHTELRHAENAWQKFQPLLHFNVGRLVSYAVLGGVIGVIGQSITLSTALSGYMSIAVAFIMLWLALTILQIVPKGSFPIRPPKRLSHWIHDLSESDHPAAPFALGAFTFFLPCGFTQSLQLVALASGNFASGAVIMGTFALGTLPSLLGLSAISSTATGAFSRLFLRFSGSLVLLLALFNLQSGLALAGVNLPAVFSDAPTAVGDAPAVRGGVQTVAMKVTPRGYEPKNLTIKAGVPVRWVVDGTGAAGCTSVMTIPDLRISQVLQSGTNVIEFTAPKPGQLAFMCSMGMVRGSFTVI